ncbi:MAG: chemotaxis protein CheB [Acidobacteria bacterium]|nr:chemotaxis protein CheB [Acidobacteriota bacterium]
MRFDLVVIGASRGGLAACRTLLSGVPRDFPAPVVLVQHRLEDEDSPLAALLQQDCALPVVEPRDKEALLPGKVFLAPPGYHLLVDGPCFALSVDEPVHYSRPSIDVLFESAAASHGEAVLALLLTGDSVDGTAGLATVKQHGGFTVVQDPATAEAPAMPESGVAAGVADQVLKLDEMARTFRSWGSGGT